MPGCRKRAGKRPVCGLPDANSKIGLHYGTSDAVGVHALRADLQMNASPWNKQGGSYGRLISASVAGVMTRQWSSKLCATAALAGAAQKCLVRSRRFQLSQRRCLAVLQCASRGPQLLCMFVLHALC